MKVLFKMLIIIILSILLSCATSKNVQKVDGPEDYYDSEVVTSTTQVGPSENSNTKSEERQDLSKGIEQKTKEQASQRVQNRIESEKTGTPKSESKQDSPVPFKLEENPLPQGAQDELSDDNWAKDESNLRLRKKDKDKIKDSPLDDDKWGKE